MENPERLRRYSNGNIEFGEFTSDTYAWRYTLYGMYHVPGEETLAIRGHHTMGTTRDVDFVFSLQDARKLKQALDFYILEQEEAAARAVHNECNRRATRATDTHVAARDMRGLPRSSSRVETHEE